MVTIQICTLISLTRCEVMHVASFLESPFLFALKNVLFSRDRLCKYAIILVLSVVVRPEEHKVRALEDLPASRPSVIMSS